MFKFLQHLFTLRAIENENKTLLAKVKTLEVTVSELQHQNDQNRKAHNELQRQYEGLEHEFNQFKHLHSQRPLHYPKL